jgi:hypothetical protein
MNHPIPRIFVSTLLLFGAIGLCLKPAVVTAQSFSADAHWAPAHTNVLTLINSSKIFKSELAIKSHAAEASKAAFASGVSIVTPNADRILIASHLDFEVMHTVSTAAVYSRARSKFDLTEMANRIGASVELLGGRGTVLLPNDAMVVQLTPDTVGVMKPGNRQAVANWLRKATASGSNQLSPYLVQSISYADKNADIIIAMDLSDAIPPSAIRKRLSEMSSVEKTEVDSVAAALEGITGITLGVTVHDSIHGSIKIDFESNAMVLEKCGKPVLIEILEHRGLMIDDISTWTSQSTNRQLLLSGPLSMAGLRSITSLVSQPLLPEFSDEENGVDDSAYARSKTYFKSLESYVNELATKRPSNRGLKNYATWFETYATKIDGFSILNVDPELVAVGDGVAESLRQMATVARESDVKIKKDQSEIRAEILAPTGDYGYGYGYAYRYNNNRGSRLKKAETEGRGDAENTTREIMTAIEAEVAGIRKKMSLKYGVDF